MRVVRRLNGFLDYVFQVGGVQRHQIAFLHRAFCRPLESDGIGDFYQLFNLMRLQSSLFVEKLHSVPVPRQVARRNHNGSVAVRLRKDTSHEHGRRRRHVAVENLRSVKKQPVRDGVLELLPAQPGIAAYRDAQLLLSCFFRKPCGEGACQVIHRLVG